MYIVENLNVQFHIHTYMRIISGLQFTTKSQIN